MKLEKSVKNPPNGVEKKALVYVKDESCSLIMGVPTK